MARDESKDLYAGQVFGELRVIQKVRTPPNSPGGQRYRIECSCGTRRTVPRFYLMRKNGPLRHCGCLTPKADEPYTKRTWHSMHLRCYYTKHVAYKDYGGRGIEVCWRWHRDNPEGWENFKKDMGVRPKGKSIDRIDPNGHYEPIHRETGKPQCRWATMKQQRANQRHNTTYDPDADYTE